MFFKKGKGSKWGSKVTPSSAYPEAWVMDKDEKKQTEDFNTSVREAYKHLLKKKNK
jgi:hypothetical protein